jgi:hypothetical protein
MKVKTVAVSDGIMLYAADLRCGGVHDRVFVSLQQAEPPESLWWLSVHGIYREHHGAGAGLRLLPDDEETSAAPPSAVGVLLHPKYHLPVSCFAYAGSAADPGTWKLPYRRADGSIDVKRLPKAIQAVLSNYRPVT